MIIIIIIIITINNNNNNNNYKYCGNIMMIFLFALKTCTAFIPNTKHNYIKLARL